MSDSVRPHRQQPTRLLHPWDSPGKNTGVGCHFLLQRMKVKSESEVALLCLTLSDPMDCGLPGSSVHGTFQARVLEWGAIAFSWDKSRSRHFRHQSCVIPLGNGEYIFGCTKESCSGWEISSAEKFFLVAAARCKSCWWRWYQRQYYLKLSPLWQDEGSLAGLSSPRISLCRPGFPWAPVSVLLLVTENPADAMEDFSHLRILQSTTFLKIACSNLSNPDYRCGVVLLSQTWSTCPHIVKASNWHQVVVKEITAFITGAKEEWGELTPQKPKLPEGF